MYNVEMLNRSGVNLAVVPVRWLAGLFLLVNFASRLAVLHDHGFDIPAVVLSSAVFFLLVWKKPGLLVHFCLVLGISFPLYCYQAYTINNQFFEFLVVFLGIISWCRLFHNTGARINREIIGLLTCYLLLTLFSLALFPISSFVRFYSLWGLLDFSSAIFSATPENPFYSLAAADRLVLFVIVILLISRQHDAPMLYRKLLLGAAVGGLFATVAGVLNQYGVLDLTWLRPQFIDPSGIPRLHSVMGNPGWFAQYLLACLPFICLLRPGGRLSAVRLVTMAVIFLFCGLALLLTGSRTSWLIFPVEFFLCSLYLLLFRDQSGQLFWRDIYAGAVKITAIFLLVSLLVVAGFFSAVKSQLAESSAADMSRAQYILKRLQNIVTPGERVRVWRESLILGQESPVFGMGFEGYKWHQRVMTSISNSQFARNRQTVNNWDTPHSFFLQLFISNGIAGVAVWCFLTLYVVIFIGRDLLYRKQAVDMLFLISLSILLLYGLTQSLQYIPLIWFLLFLIFGYAMTLDRELLPSGFRTIQPYVFAVCILLVLTGGNFYFRNARSRHLASEYGLTRYGDDRGQEMYSGFYPKETWGKEGVFRWSGPQAKVEFNRDGVVRFTFVCNAPGLALNPIVLDVLVNNRPVDRYTFWRQQKLERTYQISAENNLSGNIVHFRVSRTWNPKLSGLGKDTRNLGVAVSEPRFLGRMLSRDLGVSDWQVAEEKKGQLIRYRWTSRSAIFTLKKYGKKRLNLMVKSEQPFAEKKPQVVRFFQNNEMVGSLKLIHDGWSNVSLLREPNCDAPLKIMVQRTWNPRKEGYGEDPRDLGIAVATTEE